MADLRDLYQEVILDHAKNPRNYGLSADEDVRKAVGHNPLCGDKLVLALKVRDGVVTEARFQGEGCAISKASASLMTETLKGRPVAEAQALHARFHELVTGEPLEAASGASLEEARVDLGKLAVFAGVAEYPARVKCASLAWHAMAAALAGETDEVTTE
jgi:nitrogen fixation NifU-like protein